jgi:hypothetical protein
MLDAGVAIILSSGKTKVKELLSFFSNYLSRPAGASKMHDIIRESVVIFMGTVKYFVNAIGIVLTTLHKIIQAAQHLNASDDKIPQVVSQLVETLKTPSETVQVAVSDCLPPLMKAMSSDNVGDLVRTLLITLFDSPKYGERRGAA